MARDSSPIFRADDVEVVEATLERVDAGAKADTSSAESAKRPNKCQDENFIMILRVREKTSCD